MFGLYFTRTCALAVVFLLFIGFFAILGASYFLPSIWREADAESREALNLRIIQWLNFGDSLPRGAKVLAAED